MYVRYQAFTTRLTIHTAVEKSLRNPVGTGLSRPEGDFHQYGGNHLVGGSWDLSLVRSPPSDEADDGATSLTAERLVSLKVPLVNFRRVARMTVGGENGGKPVLVCLSPCTGSEEPQNQPWIKAYYTPSHRPLLRTSLGVPSCRCQYSVQGLFCSLHRLPPQQPHCYLW